MKTFTKKEFIRNVVDHLRDLGEGTIQPQQKNIGICPILTLEFDVWDLYDSFEQLPGFSGHRVFPIKHPTLDPMYAYLNSKNLWADDEYGDNRREACLYLADWIEDNYL